jgi:molybdate transport system substrate-binding protein
MRGAFRSAAALLFILIAAAASGPKLPASEPLLVSAAISLTQALGEVQEAHLRAGGGAVRFNFGASNVLARQIANGARIDLFISADEAQMDYVQKANGIDPSTRVALLANRLAIVTPRGHGLPASDVRALADGRVRRVAIGDPAAVPAGVYARQYLERVGLWTTLQPKLLTLASVRAALAAAESGGADAAIVYESDVASGGRVDLALVVAGPEAPKIVYPAAIVVRSRQRDAAAKFLWFLGGPEAGGIFSRYRFTPLGPDRRGAGGPADKK